MKLWPDEGVIKTLKKGFEGPPINKYKAWIKRHPIISIFGILILVGAVAGGNSPSAGSRYSSSTNNNIFGFISSIKIDSGESCADLQMATYGVTEYNEVREYICYDECGKQNVTYDHYRCSNDKLLCYCKDYR